MRKKRVLIRTLSALAVMAMIASGLFYFTKLMERKSSQFKLLPFFSGNADYDVLFLGTSHVLNALLPQEIWDQYGITSYNLGAHGAPLPTSYWVLRMALEHCQPKTVLIDCKSLELNTKTAAVYSQVHQIMDAMPLSWTKIQAVADLLNDPYYEEVPGAERRELIGLLWDFSVYHYRWDELGMGDFLPTQNRQKGAEVKTFLATPDQYDMIGDDETLTERTVGVEYLCRMIELCQSRGIRPVLTFLPFPSAEMDQRSANTMEKIAEEYGIPCINFLKKQVIDFQTDMADSDSHVNFSGAQKLSAFIGQYLRDNLDISDRRQEDLSDAWNADYQTYLKDVLRSMQEANTLEQYMLQLTDPHNDTVIELYDRSIYQNSTYVNLLKNLGVDDKELAENADLIVIRCGQEATVCRSFKKDGVEADTVLGKMSYRIENREESEESPYYVISADAKELFALPRSINAHTDLRVHVFEHSTGELLLHSSFILKSKDDFKDGFIEVIEMNHER